MIVLGDRSAQAARMPQLFEHQDFAVSLLTQKIGRRQSSRSRPDHDDPGLDVARRQRWWPKAALQIIRQDKQYECGRNKPLRHKEGAWPKQPLENPKDKNDGSDEPNPPANPADLWSK